MRRCLQRSVSESGHQETFSHLASLKFLSTDLDSLLVGLSEARSEMRTSLSEVRAEIRQVRARSFHAHAQEDKVASWVEASRAQDLPPCVVEAGVVEACCRPPVSRTQDLPACAEKIAMLACLRCHACEYLHRPIQHTLP